MRAEVLRTVELRGAWWLRAIDRTGTAVFGSSRDGVLRLASNDAMRIWPGHSPYALESGRVLARKQSPAGLAGLWVLSEGEPHFVSAPDLALDPASMHATWASEGTLWLAGQIESGDVWVGEVDERGAVLSSATLTPPDFDGRVALVARGLGRAWLTWSSGQHGTWGHLVDRTRGTFSIERVPAPWVHDGVVVASGEILTIEDGCVVRRDHAMRSLASFDPGSVRLDRLIDHPSAILAISEATGQVFSLGRRGESVEGALDTAELFQRGRFRTAATTTVGAGSVLATATVDEGVTRLALWTPAW